MISSFNSFSVLCRRDKAAIKMPGTAEWFGTTLAYNAAKPTGKSRRPAEHKSPLMNIPQHLKLPTDHRDSCHAVGGT
jgi:hypothetical protein